VVNFPLKRFYYDFLKDIGNISGPSLLALPFKIVIVVSFCDNNGLYHFSRTLFMEKEIGNTKSQVVERIWLLKSEARIARFFALCDVSAGLNPPNYYFYSQCKSISYFAK